MQAQITGDNIEITQELRDIIFDKLTSKLDVLLKDFEEDIKHTTIKISQTELGEYTINFNMWLPGGTEIFAQKNGHEFTTAVVNLREAIEHQIKKYRSKIVYN